MGYAVQLYFDAKLEDSLTRTRSALTAAGVTPTLERLGDRVRGRNGIRGAAVLRREARGLADAH